MKTAAPSPQWLERLLGGSKPELGEALSLIERGGDAARELLGKIDPHSGRAHVVGLTGPPGSGKSTLASALALHLVEEGRRVGVIAVDPSSPFTGGAVLGDRIRMSRASGHERIFIRSTATRGALGGLARTTEELVRVLDAAGYDLILVETVGVGQSEVDIWRVAHTPIVIDVPGSGEAVQGMKAGVFEIAAILCLNKSDLPGKEAKVSQLQEVARYARERMPGWSIPVVATVASSGAGMAELADCIRAHFRWLSTTGSKEQLPLPASIKAGT
ncbi:MAG: methylmalonyl Co-A mutase-associated GTPase MeaB [Steroidobacteraceae bacterium]